MEKRHQRSRGCGSQGRSVASARALCCIADGASPDPSSVLRYREDTRWLPPAGHRHRLLGVGAGCPDSHRELRMPSRHLYDTDPPDSGTRLTHHMLPPQTARHRNSHTAPRTVRKVSVPERRQLLQPGPSPGLYVEVFPSYGSSSVPAVLPIPASLQPARVTAASNFSYAESSTSDLFKLAGVSTYFALRFSGAFGAWMRVACSTEGWLRPIALQRLQHYQATAPLHAASD